MRQLLFFREAYENHSLEELANDFYEYVEVLDYQYEQYPL